MIQSNKPKVSLIIACYNQANELEKVLCSLKNQTLKDFEIVIADDGSGLEVAKVVDAYSQQFSHPVQHVWQENLGNRKPRIVNLAVKKSKADLLVFIDADCLLHHRFLSSHYKWRKTGLVLTGRRISFDASTSKQLNLNQIENGHFERPYFWWNRSKPN